MENQPGERLRKKAERIINQKGVMDSSLYSRSLEDLVQELSIHQIELEHQNVSLDKVREETEAVRDKYVDLYHNAPNGYVTIDEDRRIVEHNAVFARMLENAGNRLIEGKLLTAFVDPGSQDELYFAVDRIIRQKKDTGRCEIVLRTPSDRRINARLELVRRDTGKEDQPVQIRAAVIDITDIRRAENDRDAMQLFYQHTLDALPEHIAVVDRDSNIVYVNRAWRKFGRENNLAARRDCVGQNYLSVCEKASGEEKDQVREIEVNMRKILSGDMEFYSVEYPCHSEEQNRWFRLNMAGFSMKGEQWAVIAHENITGIKEASLQLAESENKLKSIVSSVPDAMCMLDRNLKVVWANDRAREVFGENLISKKCTSAYGPLIHACEDCIAGKTFSDGRVHSKEYTHEDVNGQARTFLCRTSAAGYGGDGRPHRVMEIMHDITEQKSRERSMKFMEIAVDNTGDGIFWITPEGGIRYVNKAVLTLTGYTEEEITSLTVTDIDRDMQPEEWSDHWKEFRRKGTMRFETVHIAKDGTEIPFEVTASYIRLDNGEEYNFSVVRDIRERERMIRQLEEAKEKAEAATRAKSDFLATMSHEIRTPMNSILGMSHLALESGLNEIQYNQVSNINSAADALLSIINDILDVSKIEAGKLTLSESEFQFCSIMEKIFNVMKFSAHEKDLDLIYDSAHEIPLWLFGDATRVSQVIMNLLSNAVKYTSSGDIAVTSEVVDEKEGLLTLKVTVEDPGIGISTDEMERLFKPFSQVDSSTTRRYGGTGLGLVIVKRLVELMDGEVTVSSEPGQGSRFTATMRMARARTADFSAFGVDRLAGLKAIVIESGERVGRALVNGLSALNVLSERVDSVEEAIRSLEAEGSGKRTDIVLIDREQFRLCGREEFARLEDLPQLSGAMFVVMYDFNSFQPASDNARRILDRQKHTLVFLEKPVTSIKLIKALVQDESTGQKELSKETEGQLEKTRKDESKGNGKDSGSRTVLVVDDDSLNREIVTAFLERDGVTVQEVDNGEAAVQKIAHESFDMVFMDVEMPVMDGYEATRQIRRLEPPWSKEIPIIAVTGHALEEFRDRCFEAGMDDHMEKPIKPDRVKEMVRKWSPGQDKKQKKEKAPRSLPAGTSLEKDAADPKGAENGAQETQALEQTEFINVQEGLSYVNQNRAMYAKLIKKFVKTYSDTGVLLYEVVESGNFTEAVQLMHKIKSISAMIGAGELSRTAGKLEGFFKDLKSGPSDETDRSSLPADSELFSRIRQKTDPFLEMLKNVISESHQLIEIFEKERAGEEKKDVGDRRDPESEDMLSLLNSLIEFVKNHQPIECRSVLARMINKNTDSAIGEKLKQIEALVDGYRFEKAEKKLVRLKDTFSSASV